MGVAAFPNINQRRRIPQQAMRLALGDWFNPIGCLIRVIVCSCSLLWLVFPALAAPAAVLSVNGATGTINPADPCPNPRDSAIYKTIQKAVNCALAGDTIVVAAGTH